MKTAFFAIASCLFLNVSCQQSTPPVKLTLEDHPVFSMVDREKLVVTMHVVPGKEEELINIINKQRACEYAICETNKKEGISTFISDNDGCMYNYELRYDGGSPDKSGHLGVMRKTHVCTYATPCQDVKDCFTPESWQEVRRKLYPSMYNYNKEADKCANSRLLDK